MIAVPDEAKLAALAAELRWLPAGTSEVMPGVAPLTFLVRCRFRRTKVGERTSSSPMSSRGS